MILKDIYASSNYLTDEEMTTDQAVSVANGAKKLSRRRLYSI